MVKINLKEGTELEFDMLIEGNITKLESLGLCIQEDQFELKLPCVFSNSKITCYVPVLEGIVSPGEKNISLEIVIDGKVYKPFEQSIEFEKPLSIKTQLHTIEESSKKPNVSMVSMSMVKKAAPAEKPAVQETVAAPAKTSDGQKSLVMLQARTNSLLQKIAESSISPKVALRDVHSKASLDIKTGSKLINVWSKMLESKNINLNNIETDSDAVICLEKLKSLLGRLLTK